MLHNERDVMDKLLKQRLIGASILIALAVIFLPMLFDSPEEQALDRELTIELPSPPGDRPPIRRLPLDPDQARAPTPETRAGQDRTVSESELALSSPGNASSDRNQPPSETVAEADRPEQNGAPPVEDQVSDSSPEPIDDDPAPEAIEPPAADPEPPVAVTESESDDSVSADGEGFMVQVASFSSRQNADELVARLTALGHVAQIDRVVRGPSELHRVRTGPYPERGAAERALSQIRQTVTGVQPVIVGSLQPESMADDGAGQPSGFAVQVGSFASRNNALRLLDQLSSRGLEAFVHQDLAGSRTIWRVRVGPVGSREEAEARLTDLVDRENLDGLVVSHP